MTKTGEDILDAIECHRREITRFGVRRLALFGSSARGEQTPDSDLDFVVEFQTKAFRGHP